MFNVLAEVNFASSPIRILQDSLGIGVPPWRPLRGSSAQVIR